MIDRWRKFTCRYSKLHEDPHTLRFTFHDSASWFRRHAYRSSTLSGQFTGPFSRRVVVPRLFTIQRCFAISKDAFPTRNVNGGFCTLSSWEEIRVTPTISAMVPSRHLVLSLFHRMRVYANPRGFVPLVSPRNSANRQFFLSFSTVV